MQGKDQTEITTAPAEQSSDKLQTVQPTKSVPSRTPAARIREFDWLAIGVVLLIAALFALAARLNPHPETSLTPAAVLSATGCGLLVTALRKLHTSSRPGLFEAAVGGLFLALFQFMAAITYPNVVYALSLAYDERLGFLTTWALIAAFSIIFSILGATLGHLAFAPLRPLPTRTNTLQPLPADAGREEPVPPARSQHSLVSYLISVLLLGLAPTLVAYVFSAAFDYMLRANLFFPGPYPTLRLLSTMLPWQIPIPFNLSSSDPNSLIFLLWQLWRIPLFLGNPTMFDVQALEPYVFNGAALGFLLLTMRDQHTRSNQAPDASGRPLSLSWPTFILNLVTGPLVCVGIGIFLRLLRSKQASLH